MKSRLLLFAILALTVIVFIVFKLNESFVVEKLTRFFPAKDENTPGYYVDLIGLLFSEAVWLIALLVLSVYLSVYAGLGGVVNRIEENLIRNKGSYRIIFFLAFIAITVAVATAGLKQFPNSADEFAYLFQAQQLSEGKLWDDVHAHPDFFEFHHLAQKDGKWVGRFPPGWPLLLSIAYVAHIPPFLINTILGVLCCIVLYKLARNLYDERIAMWSVIAMAFSSYFIFNAATFFSHIASLLQGLLFVYLSHRFVQTRKYEYAVGAGVFLGLLVMTRQLTALIFFLPMLIYIVHQLRGRAILPLLVMGIAAAPSVAFFLWYNYRITGDPFVPVTMWTNSDEALGFVKGHTPMKGAKFTFKRLVMFFYWASPSLLLMYFIYLFYKLKNLRKFLHHPEDYLFLLLIVGYFFYYHSGGNQYGPRFYLEGFPFLVVFIVAKALRTDNRWGKAFLFCAILYNAVKIPFVAYREHQVVEERIDIYSLVEEKNISNAVVFISSGTGVIRPMPVEDLNRNDRYYRNHVIYARDLGEENLKLMEYYKNKDFYIYRRGVDQLSGELIAITPESWKASLVSTR